MTPEQAIQIIAIRTRAHIHGPSCYGTYETCGEHHAHSDRCGGRVLICLRRATPDVVSLLAIIDAQASEFRQQNEGWVAESIQLTERAERTESAFAEVERTATTCERIAEERGRRISTLESFVYNARSALTALAEASDTGLRLVDMPPGCRDWMRAKIEAARELASRETP